MSPESSSRVVYHGTDAASATSIQMLGLNRDRWRAAGGLAGVDEKGFSVTVDRKVAEAWAQFRAAERGGPPAGVVLEADADSLPLQGGSAGVWTDSDEFFIAPEDFERVRPGTMLERRSSWGS